MTTSRDGCVVATESLADVLGGFVQARNRVAPPGGGKFAPRRGGPRGRVAATVVEASSRTDVPLMSAYEWLEQETAHHDPDGRGVSRKTIKRIVARGSKTTELRVADLLVAAIGRPDLFYNGSLEVRPNPRASPSARASCCAGSAGGALAPPAADSDQA